ncbi:hypothetical protein HS041_07165 [Planomonospora sp. ID67723]|uniref:hypothetical protein n=1 Tax=Planomonospora sp. ID67723 TaxID=2738134 RepID=UPI0018C42750|nr:hypothetical protein [Planomonospora sp. ID67723]MBG0827541.1 hypothetical protein [Planomonospora sp. ID67723]
MKTIAAFMLGIGLALGLAGLVGDALGAWENSPFFTNLLSSLTGFLFAVPVGVIVLYQITIHREELQQRRSLASLALDSSTRIVAHSNQLQARPYHITFQQGSSLFFKLRGQALDAIEEILINPPEKRRITEKNISTIVDLGSRCRDAWTHVWASPTTIADTVEGMRSNLTILREYVQPRLHAVSDTALIDAEILDHFQEVLDWIAPPGGDPTNSPRNWTISAGIALDELEQHGDQLESMESHLDGIVHRLHAAIMDSEQANAMYETLNNAALQLHEQISSYIGHEHTVL